MRYLIFIILVIGYLTIAVVGLTENDYVDVNTYDKMMWGNWVIMIGLALFVGSLFCVLLILIFGKKQNQKYGGLVGLAFMIGFLAFFTNRGLIMFYNTHFGKQEKLELIGTIGGVWIENGSKGGTSYYLSINDTNLNKEYRFKIHRDIYEILRPNSSFKEEFRIGSLGIIYRK